VLARLVATRTITQSLANAAGGETLLFKRQ
jgi:hypothetical protein